MAEEPVAQGVEVPGDDLRLSLTPEQQAADIQARMNEFNKELDPLCKKYHFAITVVRQDLPNGFVWQPQLVDTKFAPKPPVMPQPEVAPAVETAEEAPVAEAPAEESPKESVEEKPAE